jgi:hypothetical protein
VSEEVSLLISESCYFLRFQMTVSWDPPAIDQRNGNITFYRAILTPLDPGEEKMIQNVSKQNS